MSPRHGRSFHACSDAIIAEASALRRRRHAAKVPQSSGWDWQLRSWETRSSREETSSDGGGCTAERYTASVSHRGDDALPHGRADRSDDWRRGGRRDVDLGCVADRGSNHRLWSSQCCQRGSWAYFSATIRPDAPRCSIPSTRSDMNDLARAVGNGARRIGSNFRGKVHSGSGGEAAPSPVFGSHKRFCTSACRDRRAGAAKAAAELSVQPTK